MSSKIVTEGDSLIQTDTVRKSFNIDGTGIKMVSYLLLPSGVIERTKEPDKGI